MNDFLAPDLLVYLRQLIDDLELAGEQARSDDRPGLATRCADLASHVRCLWGELAALSAELRGDRDD